MTDESIYGLALLIAVVWPLLLAFPAVHTKLPAIRQLALLPALFILIWPRDAWLEMPELLMGVDLLLNTETRWLLGMALLIWLVVARLESRDLEQAEPESALPFFMLTLSGHLGAILANDMMGFFLFSTLMGYGFFGLIAARTSATGESGRMYIVALVLGDLALFEAMLLAAFSVGELQYASVRASISASDSSGLYVWMVLLGFGLRASIWPASNWSLRLFAELPPQRLLLLVAVPIATGWLGMWRWLPLQPDTFPLTGLVLVLVGGLGLLYGLLHSMVYRRYAWLPGRLVMMSGSGLVLLIGVLLSGSGDSVVDVTPFYRVVAVLIVSLAGMSYIMTKRSSAEDRAIPLSRRYINSGTVRLATRKKLHELSEAVTWRLQRIRETVKPPNGFLISFNRPFPHITGWTSRLIGFVVLVLILAWLAAGG